MKRIGALGVENGPGIDLGGDLKGDARGQVGFDHPGDDIDGRTLGGDDQMNAGSARQLRETSNTRLNLGRERPS
jgi:hypothetical protein